MKTDRELLELAARAAGIFDEHEEVSDCTSGGFWLCDSGKGYPWNPLTDDGDALRLAVKLGMHIQVNRCHPAHGNPRAEVWIGRGLGEYRLSECCAHDETAYQSATRRAIVRAAAAIGEGIK